MPLALLLAASLAPSAPVPVNEPAEKRRLESLWTELSSHDPVARVRAAFALRHEPKAVAFLAEKLPPVEASKDQLTGWLTDLNSDDETVWEPAFESLRYFDPRIGLTLYEQSALATTDQGRRLLASLWHWSDEGIKAVPDASNTLTWRAPFSRSVSFDQQIRGGGGVGHQIQVKSVGEITPAPWRSAALAALVLDRTDRMASRTALDRLADGHPDALPTRTAVAARRARFTPPYTQRFEPMWPKLLDPDPVESTRWAFSLADRPELVRGLRAKLPPIRATKEQMAAWLDALNDDDVKVWQPAYEKLLYFRPTLALSFDEQCELMTTEHGQMALCEMWCFDDRVPDRVGGRHVGGGTGEAWELRQWVSIDRLRDLTRKKQLDPTDQTRHRHWQRARIAILALEHAGTPDAKAVLKQLADGHPDILPTKEAKAALERLK